VKDFDEITDQELLDSIRKGSVLITLNIAPLHQDYPYSMRLTWLYVEARRRNLIDCS